MTKEQRKKRQTKGTIAVILVFVLLVCILVKVQLIDGAKYRAAGANLAVSQTTIKASRGEILDCNGEPLVTNRQGYSVIFKYSDFPSAKNQQERNELISTDTDWIVPDDITGDGHELLLRVYLDTDPAVVDVVSGFLEFDGTGIDDDANSLS